MKRRKLLLPVCFVALCLSVAPAMADLASLQGVLDNITVAPVFHDSSVNVNTDMLLDGTDKHWHITGTSGSVSTIVIELAGFANTNIFGVYNIANPASRVPIFTGANVFGDQALLSIDSGGNVYVNFAYKATFGSDWFGYYLDSSAGQGGGVWYSDTALNADNKDHMLAYEGTNTDTVQIPRPAPLPPWGAGLWTNNEFILAWEDLKINGADQDYDDFVVMVESVVVPVPAAVLLGMLGLSVAGLKLRKFA